MGTHEHRDDAGDQEGDDREVRDDPDAIGNRQNAERVPDVRFAVDAAELGAEGDHGQPHRDGAKGRPGGLANVLIWFESWGFALLFALFFAVTLVFPSGHLPARRAGRAARAALGAIPVGLAVIAFGPELGGVYGEAHVRNPFGVLPISDRVWVIPYLAIVALLVAGVISMLVRSHRARGVERQQLKWLAAATALAAAASHLSCWRST